MNLETSIKVDIYSVEFLQMIIADAAIDVDRFNIYKNEMLKKYEGHPDLWIVTAVVKDYIGGALFHIFKQYLGSPTFHIDYPNEIQRMLWG